MRVFFNSHQLSSPRAKRERESSTTLKKNWAGLTEFAMRAHERVDESWQECMRISGQTRARVWPGLYFSYPLNFWRRIRAIYENQPPTYLRRPRSVYSLCSCSFLDTRIRSRLLPWRAAHILCRCSSVCCRHLMTPSYTLTMDQKDLSKNIATGRAIFNCVESYLELPWFCFTTLYDWFKKLAPPSQPIKFKNKTNRTLVARVFPRMAPVSYICFEFSFSNFVVYVYCDWPL